MTKEIVCEGGNTLPWRRYTSKEEIVCEGEIVFTEIVEHVTKGSSRGHTREHIGHTRGHQEW